MKKFYILSAVLFCLLVKHSSAQTWVADSSFGVNSILTIQPGSSTSSVYPTNLLIQPDGKIICAGRDYDVQFNDQHNDMVRFDKCDGSIDSTFGTNGIVHHNFDFRNGAEDYVLQPDGKIICSGSQNSSNAASTVRAFVARYKTDGTVDSSWNNTGTTIQSLFTGASQGFSVMLTPNNRVIFTATGGNGIGDLRFLTNGSLDTSFNHTGQCAAAINFANSGHGHLLQNGKIINVFPYSTGNAYTAGAVLFDSTGTRDLTFGNSGLFNYTLDVANFVISAIQPDENIIIAMSKISQPISYVLRLTPTGVLDSTFGTNGTAFVGDATNPVGEVNNITVLQNGKILIEGSTGFGATGIIARLNNNGTIDATFGSNGYLTRNDMGYITTAIELTNGDLLIAGISNAAGANEMIVRYTLQSNLPLISFNGTILSTTGIGTYQWFFNGNPAGTNSNTFTPTTNGTYTLQITDALGCNRLSAAFVITTTGINEIAGENGINIYPNPAKGEFTITLNAALLNAQVVIFNVLGENVFEINISNELKTEINLKNISAGMYFVKVSDGEKQYTKKLIVEDN